MNNMTLKICYGIYHTDMENGKSSGLRGRGKGFNRIQYQLLKKNCNQLATAQGLLTNCVASKIYNHEPLNTQIGEISL